MSWEIPGWMSYKPKSRHAGENINSLRYVDDTTLTAESEEELKSLLLRVKEESQGACLRLNIKKAKIMASGSITSWQIEGENVEIMRNFFSWAPKITADNGCSHEIRRRFPSWKESYDKPRQCAEKQRHYSADKGLCSQGYDLSQWSCTVVRAGP